MKSNLKKKTIDYSLLIELQNLHDEVYQMALTWYNSLPQLKKEKILDIYGITQFPEPETDFQSNGNFQFN